MKNIVILGSTGTVGMNALEVVRKRKESWRVLGLACRGRRELLASQIKEFAPSFVYTEKKDASFQELFPKVRFFHGKNGLEELVSVDGVDLTIYAVPGISTLPAFIRSVEKGHRIGLATKEILVSAGSLIDKLLCRYKEACILPVDSEHNAIFQALAGEDKEKVRRIYLTASGGPFRKKKVSNPSVSDVLAHPVWNMGAKITVDSATMFNKAFELIEAHHLFGFPAEKLDVLIHPEAIIHGLAEMVDGTVKGVFSMPDMKFPITYVIDYPERKSLSWERLDFSRFGSFTLEPADKSSAWFSLAMEAIKKKGTFPAVLNSANEQAVKLFLAGSLSFRDIFAVTEKTLSLHSYKKDISIEEIIEIDRWSKRKVSEIAKAI